MENEEPPATIFRMNDLEFRTKVLDVVKREFGLGGYSRFLMMFCSGKGDYTAERHQWLGSVTLEDLERELLPNEASERSLPIESANTGRATGE